MNVHTADHQNVTLKSSGVSWTLFFEMILMHSLQSSLVPARPCGELYIMSSSAAELNGRAQW